LSDWHLLGLRLWHHRNRLRLACRLLHRKLKWFHDDGSKRLTDLHILFPSFSPVEWRLAVHGSRGLEELLSVLKPFPGLR